MARALLIYAVSVLVILVLIENARALPSPCTNISVACTPGTPYMLLNCTVNGQILLTGGCYEISDEKVFVYVYVPSGENVTITCQPIGFGETRIGEKWNNTVRVSIPVKTGETSYFMPGESLPLNCVALSGNSSSNTALSIENADFCMLCIEGLKVVASHARTCAPGTDEVEVKWGSPISLMGFPLIPVLEIRVVAPENCEVVELEGNVGPIAINEELREVRLGPLEIASLILKGRLTLSYEVRGVVLREKGGCFISRSVDEGAITLSPYILWFVIVAGVLVFAFIGVIKLLKVEEVDVA